MSGIRMKDVAEYAGVSVATVSKYFNNIRISDENKVKIEEGIRVLGYKMNPIARSLKTNKTYTAGILIPDFKSSFFMSLLTHMDSYFRNL